MQICCTRADFCFAPPSPSLSFSKSLKSFLTFAWSAVSNLTASFFDAPFACFLRCAMQSPMNAAVEAITGCPAQRARRRSSRRLVREQRNQQDDGNRDAEKEKKYGTHCYLLDKLYE